MNPRLVGISSAKTRVVIVFRRVVVAARDESNYAFELPAEREKQLDMDAERGHSRIRKGAKMTITLIFGGA